MASKSVVQEEQHESWSLSIDEDHYETNPESIAFFKKETGIKDDERLKQHILQVQAKAFKVYQYPCIRIFEFMRLKLAQLPAYQQVLKLGKENEDAIFLDLGCCFGNDSRKLVLDGYPIQNVVASDLRKELWEIGHEMFCSTPSIYPVRFLEGDVFDTYFLAPLPASSPPTPRPDIHSTSVTSLNVLRGHVSAIFTGALFHLFHAPAQLSLARSLASLLSTEPGSLLLGVQGGLSDERGEGWWQPTGDSFKMWCHCPSSWRAMWEGVFRELDGEGGRGIEVSARIRREVGGDSFFGMWPNNRDPYHVLEWSVVRR